MLETMELVERTTPPDTAWDDVIRVCNLIPPLWDLRNYVAVNPFLGFASQPLEAAARFVGDGLSASVLPGIDFYKSRWQAGDFGPDNLGSAARRGAQEPKALEAILAGKFSIPLRTTRSFLTFAERHDQAYGTEWNDVVLRSAARWCAVYAVTDKPYWGKQGECSLFVSWRQAAGCDRSLDIAGLRGFRAWSRQIPTHRANETLHWALDQLNVDDSERVPYFYRLLGGVYGWASYFRRISWEKGEQEPGPLADLLAVRMCMDAAVASLAPHPVRRATAPAPQMVEDESVRLVLQDALEDGFISRLGSKLRAPAAATTMARPKVQAVLCIDVRSEPLRRHLEAESPEIETRGFAGFFGVALNWRSRTGDSARCPVLLKPGVDLCRPAAAAERGAGAALLHMQSAPASSFSFVEILGITYGVRLVGDAVVVGSTTLQPEGTHGLTLAPDDAGCGIPPGNRIALASAILKNMGFRSLFAPLVLLCGHEGHSANNPHQASLDCGACGGHSGAINARVAAALLNDSNVRAALSDEGWNIPGDTHFLPGVHSTSTDEVVLLDTDQVPAGHAAEMAQLQHWLKHAAEAARAERASALGVGERPAHIVDRLMRRRARDWSEVRPEWALARNAAFIAARRARTRGLDLEGRAFLHEYDAVSDPDDSILTLILTAPMVVASWINLQYFASTVDNRVFGAGDKALHNRVEALGIVLGNGGDLRTGLPLQSVHSADGRWFHEPLRLQVVVEAPTEQIDRVLKAQSGVMDLVQNGWVRLFALNPNGRELKRCLPGRRWELFDASEI